MLKSLGSTKQAGWRSLGRVTALPDVGWYALDLRGRKGSPQSADGFEQVCLSDKQGPDAGSHILVERIQVADGILKIKVVGPLPDGCDQLWTVRMTPQHLWLKLRDGIAELGAAELADKLANGSLDPLSKSRHGDYPPGFLPSQRLAYQACTEPGLHAVWGPPGTGKTRVLARAIEDLVRDGKRVLLVSTANVAVDNALNEVVKNVRPRPGEVLRVGPPHLPELAANDDVQLHRLAAQATTEVEGQLRQVQERIAEIDAANEDLASLRRELDGFDPVRYSAAVGRVARGSELARNQAELSIAESQKSLAAEELSTAGRIFHEAQEQVDRLAPRRADLRRAAATRDELGALDREVEVRRATARTMELRLSSEPRKLFRGRRVAKELDQLRTEHARFERDAAAHRAQLEALIRQCVQAAAPVTVEVIADRDRRREAAVPRLRRAQQAAAAAERRVADISDRCQRLIELGLATQDERDLVISAREKGLPELHTRVEKLTAERQEQQQERGRLDERLQELTKRIAKLRRDAEGQLVTEARVVATTLARSRAHSAVARQRFDVVLVDEAGAVMLAEVLLAVSRATRTAVLLGDFLQLGPVTGELDRITKPSVVRWVKPDPFTHCGIRTADDAARDTGCVALLHQFRFGPNLRDLANKVVYRVLQDGVTAVSGRSPADTEVVVIDTRGLGELGHVHRSGTYTGWWPVGALLSRALVHHHATEAGGVGVVTPYKPQAEATLAALRDSGQNLSVPVGTAHSFQGREFDSVVFDLVEDGQGWIAKSTWQQPGFFRNGVRLFGVGITRARRRLYVVADRIALQSARAGTPLGALSQLIDARRVQTCRAGVLLGMATDPDLTPVSRVESELIELLEEHVQITEVHDEVTFDDAMRDHLSSARRSLWMWSPWVGVKSKKFIPLIADAVRRDVDVRVFARDDRDFIQKNPSNQRWLAELKDTGAKLIRAHVEHRKVVVVDEHVVLLGSHNPLSQRGSREVMLACRGSSFAERILTALRAKDCADPPKCPTCGTEFELWRMPSKQPPLNWRCKPCGINEPVAKRS